MHRAETLSQPTNGPMWILILAVAGHVDLKQLSEDRLSVRPGGGGSCLFVNRLGCSSSWYSRLVSWQREKGGSCDIGLARYKLEQLSLDWIESPPEVLVIEVADRERGS